MNDDELIRPLKAEPPAEVMNDALFWQRMTRDVSCTIERSRRTRLLTRLTTFAAAAVLAVGVLIARHHAPHHVAHRDLLLFDDDAPEQTAGVQIEELSDEELTRAMREFGKSHGG